MFGAESRVRYWGSAVEVPVRQAVLSSQSRLHSREKTMNGYNCPIFSAVQTCTQSDRKAIKQGIIASLVAICLSFLSPSESAVDQSAKFNPNDGGLTIDADYAEIDASGPACGRSCWHG